MRLPSSLAGFSGLAGSVLLALAAVSNAAAQSNPDIFVTPVPNAPFSAVVTVERALPEPNGYPAHFKSIREIGRDSQGRIHNEARNLEAESDGRTPPIVRIHLYDPVSRTTAYLYPRQKTFTTGIVNHPPSTEPPDALASPAGNSMPQSQFARQEDLGDKEMDGIEVHGVRETQTIPAESSGTGKEIEITDEYWYSGELHMNLEVSHSDPRTGSVVLTVTRLTREEPDPAFFAIPADYQPAAARRVPTQRPGQSGSQ